MSSIVFTHWLDEDVSDGLPVVPLADAAGDLLQEVLVVLQDIRDLVKHLVHQQRVHYGSAVRLFERTHVVLGGTRRVVNYWVRYRVQDKLKMSPSSDGTVWACQEQFTLDIRSQKTGIKGMFKTRPCLLQLFRRRTLRHCLEDYETSPDFPSTKSFFLFLGEL